jgi:predicted small secreted protein
MKKISVLFALLVIGVLITGGCTTVFEGSKSAGVGEDTLSRSKEFMVLRHMHQYQPP